jgi:hypothetical protein
VVCARATDALLAGATPTIAAILLAVLVLWPESMATIAFLGFCAVWWLFAWHGSIWATVPVAALVGLVHLLAALATGPAHAVVRLAALRFFGSRIGAYVLATAAGSAARCPDHVADVAVRRVAGCGRDLRRHARRHARGGQHRRRGTCLPEMPEDDEPYLPEDLA